MPLVKGRVVRFESGPEPLTPTHPKLPGPVPGGQERPHADAVEPDLEWTITLATLLAERMLGAALDLHPETIVLLAQQALTETRAARQIRLEANVLDATSLVANAGRLTSSHALGATLEVTVNPDLKRGDLRILTEKGSVDAPIRPQLERLAAVFRRREGDSNPWYPRGHT